MLLLIAGGRATEILSQSQLHLVTMVCYVSSDWSLLLFQSEIVGLISVKYFHRNSLYIPIDGILFSYAKKVVRVANFSVYVSGISIVSGRFQRSSLPGWHSCKACKCCKSGDLLVQVAYRAYKFYSSREKCWRQKSLQYSSFINATGVINLLGILDPSQNKIKERYLLILQYKYILLSY